MHRRLAVLLSVLTVMAALGLIGSRDGAETPTAPQARRQFAPLPSQAAARPVRIVAAGDIACPPALEPAEKACKQHQTADWIGRLAPAAVLTLGDNQYESGDLDGFKKSYGTSWGRFKDITFPAIGNHEYGTPGAAGYFGYFGARAGERGKGWYSFNLGKWHMVALNSNCTIVDCGEGSEQAEWLRFDLAAHPTQCTLAFWHHPRFSSGSLHGSDSQLAALWQILDEAGADIVLSGHDHTYERFAPLDAEGRPNPSGVRQFVAGTGGRNLYDFGAVEPGSEVRFNSEFGVLLLELNDGFYTWEFVKISGEDADAGQANCV